ncbi:hypothetical protein EVG20_g10663 [Dentipellis fragilis]|uniref:Uncharacterized protein n=1 Tax=Dentipellis fragilis TaxID=205917 RepID=A0A4Y9XPG1_9AGAM|nr:hypothetical protein EVG20_g10663 [Dentipellis fragilis]
MCRFFFLPSSILSLFPLPPFHLVASTFPSSHLRPHRPLAAHATLLHAHPPTLVPHVPTSRPLGHVTPALSHHAPPSRIVRRPVASCATPSPPLSPPHAPIIASVPIALHFFGALQRTLAALKTTLSRPASMPPVRSHRIHIATSMPTLRPCRVLIVPPLPPVVPVVLLLRPSRLPVAS